VVNNSEEIELTSTRSFSSTNHHHPSSGMVVGEGICSFPYPLALLGTLSSPPTPSATTSGNVENTFLTFLTCHKKGMLLF
jgi:hypothetical protein